MSNLNKKEMIKENVLSSKENFYIANDIYSHWINIKKDMLEKINEKIGLCFKKNAISCKIKPIEKTYSDRQFIEIDLGNSNLIQLQFNNYYKNMKIEVRLANKNEDYITSILGKDNGYIKNENGFCKVVDNYNFNHCTTISEFYDLYMSAESGKEQKDSLFEKLLIEIEKSFKDIKNLINNNK